MSRASRKRKVAQIEEDLSEDSRPTKKQKITKKSPSHNKNTSKNKTHVIEEEDSSGEVDVEFIPRKMTKEELKAVALQKLIASNTVNIPRESVADEESTLPDELLLQIFSHFKRKELTSLGLTCRQWNRLSHDQSLGWHAVDSFLLTEHLESYFKSHQDLDIPNPVKLEAYVRMWHDNQMEVARRYRNAFVQRSSEDKPVTIRTQTHNARLMELLNEDANVIRYVGCEEHHVEWDDLNADTDLWSYHIRKVSLEEAQNFCKSKEAIKWQRPIDEDLCYWTVDVEINIKRLEQLVATNEMIAGLQLIYNIASLELSKGIKFVSSTKRSSIPRRSFTAQQQPEGFKDEIKLYKYQLDAISWMSSVEQNTEGIPYFTAYSLPSARTDLLFSVNKTGLNQPGSDEKGRVNNIKVYNKSSNLDEVFDVVVPRGAILADEMGLGKTIEVIGLMLSVPPLKKLPEHEKLFATRATLVLCPNHLVKQWSDEIAKATDLKVAVIATIVQLKKYTYEDLLDYDVVVASYQLLSNLNYRDQRNKWIEYKSKSFASLRKKTPVLEQFYWHRLVLDEGHEYITNDQYVRYFKSLFTRFAWYVTGTPFPTESNHMYYVKEFIGIQNNRDSVQAQQDHILTDLMLRELYWRHTKESVKGEYKIPDYVEDLVLVEFDEIERVIYAGARSGGDEQAQVCGTLLHEESLDERLAKLIKDAEGWVKFYGEKVAEYKKMETNPTGTHRVTKEHINRCQEQLEKSTKVLEMALKVTPFAKRDKKITSTETSKLTLQHGSKMAHMISYLKKLFVRKPDSRVIFFSQYDSTLSGVSQVLTEHNIANVFVEGNVWKRTKALTNFKNDEDVKVIMLSLKNAASGTNLVEATHVILMDPVTGSKKEAQAIESQAIGRAFRQGQTKQITIVRFVVRNTIEHALYLRNNDVNEDTTVVVSKDNKPQLVRSSSATMLKRSGSTSNLLSVGNNTNQNMTDD